MHAAASVLVHACMLSNVSHTARTLACNRVQLVLPAVHNSPPCSAATSLLHAVSIIQLLQQRADADYKWQLLAAGHMHVQLPHGHNHVTHQDQHTQPAALLQAASRTASGRRFTIGQLSSAMSTCVSKPSRQWQLTVTHPGSLKAVHH